MNAQENERKMRQLQPNDILNMAQYYHVDLTVSPYLLAIIKQAIETPLPPNWMEGRDEINKIPIYINIQTNEKEINHPADQYFKSQIKILNEQYNTMPETIPKNAWMEFKKGDENYYYYFATNIQQEIYPSSGLFNCHVVDDDTKNIFTQAKQIHRQPRHKLLEKLDILCFYTSWNETQQNVLEKRHGDIYFSIRTKHFQFVLNHSDSVYTISHINGRNERPLEAWDLHVGAKITILGRATTLMKASMITLQWLDFQTKRLLDIKEKLGIELRKYDSHYIDTKYRRRIESPEIRQTQNGMSLRVLKNDIEHLRERLSRYRPNIAAKLVDVLYE